MAVVPARSSMSSSTPPSKRKWLKKLFKRKPDEPLNITSNNAGRVHEQPSSDGRQPSNLAENLKVSGRFALSVLPRIAGCLDENPAKMAFKILNLILQVRTEINDNNDELQRILEETLLLLSTVLVKMETGSNSQSVVSQTVEQYKREINEQLERIADLNDHLHSSLFFQVDYENYKVQLADISRRIGGATVRFNTAMAGTTGIMVDEIQTTIHDEKQEKKLRDDFQPSEMAEHRFIHNGKSALKRETCTEGTRVNILKEITEWANDSSVGSPPVFWMTGQAGAGKSTITYTITKRFEDAKGPQTTVLGANFFCSRQFGETRSLQRIVPTIAFQLSRKCGPYRAALYGVDSTGAVQSHIVGEQIPKFLFQPWKKQKCFNSQPTYLIVVDALDEIEEMERSSFLEQLLKSIEAENITGLKFLVTSRPDPDIAKLCKSFPPGAVCQLQNVPVEEAKQDVKTYLNAELTDLNGKPELDQLNEKSAGLFIYAATVVKILKRRKLEPDEQLSLLRPLLSSTSSALSSIDQLYQQIMRDAFVDLDDDLLSNRLYILHTFLCSAERISASVAASLVDTKVGIVNRVLDSLHAVLYVEESKVYWYHASFPDFIFNRSDLHVDDKDLVFSSDAASQHSLLTQACFRIMNSKDTGLRFNMGDIKSSYLLDREHADELLENVNKNISPALKYASMYWVHHICLSSATNDNRVHDLISEFLKNQFLFWVEAMNLLGLSGRCSSMLQDMLRWISETRNPGLTKDLREAANFATYFAASGTAADSTPHLYISSLATWQSVSLLSRSWKAAFLHIPMYKHTGGIVDTPIMTKKLNELVLAMAFSTDGKEVVLGIQNAAVVLDAATGQQRHVLSAEDCCLVKFSSDGNRLIIVSDPAKSDDQLVRIWETSTYHLLREFNASKATVSSEGTEVLTISVASDGHHQVQVLDISTGSLLRMVKISEWIGDFSWLVAFSNKATKFLIVLDQSVEIWDISSGCASKMLILEYCLESVQAITMSPDGKLVALGSLSDSGARVCDVSTGRTLALLPHTNTVQALNFSYDGTRIVSGTCDGNLYVWETATGAKLKVLQTNFDISVTSVAFTPDNLRIGSGIEHAAYVWPLDESANEKYDTDNGYLSDIIPPDHRDVAVSDDFRRLLSFSRGQSKVRAWDAMTGTELMVTSNLDLNLEVITQAKLSGNGENIVFALNNGSVKVLNATTSVEIIHLESKANRHVAFVTLSRSGRKLAVGVTSIDSEGVTWRVEIWGVETGKEAEFVVSRESLYGSSLAFSDDERYVVGDFKPDNGVAFTVVCDVLTGNTQKIEGEINQSSRLFSFNGGREVVTCTANSTTSDTTIFRCAIWDISSGECQKILNLLCWPSSRNHGYENAFCAINSLGISNNGKKIIAACTDGYIRTWAPVSNEGLVDVMLVYCSRALSSLTLTRDDKLFITRSWDGSLQVWDLDSDAEKYSWELQSSGWITSSRNTEHRFMWTSEMLKVMQPRNTLFISDNGHGTVDFCGSMIGENWEKCYSPRNSVDEDKEQ